jgi:excisionase family DNA binding protein
MTNPRRAEAEKAYTIADAAALKSVSPDFIRKAIRATAAPTLRAKKVGKGYRISASALESWWNELEEA